MTRYAYPRRSLRTRDWIAAIENLRRAFEGPVPDSMMLPAPVAAHPLRPAISFRPRFYRFDD